MPTKSTSAKPGPAQQPTKPTSTTSGAKQTSTTDANVSAPDLPSDLSRNQANVAGFDPTPPNRSARIDPAMDAPIQPAIAPLDSHHAPQPTDSHPGAIEDDDNSHLSPDDVN